MSKKQANSNAVHFILQGKGGVGKSLIAAVLAQYFGTKGEVKCIDTDPVNQTFENYKALNAKHLELTAPGSSKIDERNFDMLMEQLISEDAQFVVDNGASSFMPMSNYMIENDVIPMLQEAGRTVYIHVVITGGQALLDTLAGFSALAKQANTTNLVVWLNEYFGAIEANGKTFKEMKAFTENADRVKGIVRIQKRNQDTFGKDVELLVSKKLTFAEAIGGNDFSLMAKQRIKTVQKDIFEQLDGVAF